MNNEAAIVVQAYAKFFKKCAHFPMIPDCIKGAFPICFAIMPRFQKTNF